MRDDDTILEPDGQAADRRVARRWGRTGRPSPEFMRSIGQKGGLATKAGHDDDFYRRLGKKGGEQLRDDKELDDPGYYRVIGRMGGKATKAAADADYYRTIGVEGGRARQRQARQARQERRDA